MLRLYDIIRIILACNFTGLASSLADGRLLERCVFETASETIADSAAFWTLIKYQLLLAFRHSMDSVVTYQMVQKWAVLLDPVHPL